MRSMVILLCCGLSACGGSLSDALEPGASAFSDDSIVVAAASEEAPATVVPDTATATTNVEQSSGEEPPQPPGEPISLAGWNAPWPVSWGDESPFFGGWLRFTGAGSRAFANNVTAEVFAIDARSDEEMLAMMEQVLLSFAADLTISERTQSPHQNGFVELELKYAYPVGGETVQGARSLFRGPKSSLLVTLTASSTTFGEEVATLRAALESLTFEQ